MKFVLEGADVLGRGTKTAERGESAFWLCLMDLFVIEPGAPATDVLARGPFGCPAFASGSYASACGAIVISGQHVGDTLRCKRCAFLMATSGHCAYLEIRLSILLSWEDDALQEPP